MKTIIIEPGKPIRFTGNWTLADFYALLRFLLDMPLIQEQEQPKDKDNG